MYKIGDPVYGNYVTSYNKANKIDGEFQNILEKEPSDELKECLDDRLQWPRNRKCSKGYS